VLKSPNPTLLADPAIFQRYQRESAIARSITHPGVQRAIDDGAHRSEPYLVLEYVAGETLRSRMRRIAPDGKGVSLADAIDWGGQLADALAYLHHHGIVHRDLKPDNVLVSDDGRLKIADFGSAFLDGARRLTFKHLTDGIGTPDYMSPEQIQGERGDERSDIYAWGVMMYEMLAGRVPFRGDNWMATMAGHLTQDPVAITKQRPEVPLALQAVALTAMRRYPEHRYQTIAAAAEDLRRLDELDPTDFDLSAEAPMGGMAAAGSTKELWRLVAIVALAFVGVVGAILVLTVAL
jgi:serine/threonine-protein kinase